jgi:acetoin utilization deacetylase AcuC-like enzyme
VTHVREIGSKPLFKATLANVMSPYLQAYTRVGEYTYLATLSAAGVVCDAVKVAIQKPSIRSFCAIRPPGHHAGRARGEGFCIFNNVAIGALYAHAQNARVAIVDFDRHHGNGTEEIIAHADTGDLLFISSFQEGGHTYANHREPQDSRSHNIRVSIPGHSDYVKVKMLYETKVIPAIKDFRPDLLMISAGFDMHHSDPLTNLRLNAQNYGSLTNMLVAATEECGSGIVSVLEGGYNLQALRDCVRFHIKALQE